MTHSLLIVEDDADTAELLTQQLERDDFSLHVARNGEEAILIVGETAPDLVLVDLMMPRLNGFETSRFFKAKFRDLYIPILVLTAKDDPQSRARTASYGCDDYLTKPYRRANLLTAVESLLRVGQLERSLAEHLAALRDLEDASQDTSTSQDAEDSDSTRPDHPDPQAILTQIAALRTALADARLDIAQRQAQGGDFVLARNNLARALELEPNHPRAHDLQNKLQPT